MIFQDIQFAHLSNLSPNFNSSALAECAVLAFGRIGPLLFHLQYLETGREIGVVSFDCRNAVTVKPADYI